MSFIVSQASVSVRKGFELIFGIGKLIFGNQPTLATQARISKSVFLNVVIIYIGLFLCIYWFIHLFIIKPLVSFLLERKRIKKDVRAHTIQVKSAEYKKNDTRIVEKICQSAMEVLIYGLFSFIGVIVILNENWVWPSRKWWLDFDRTDVLSNPIHSYMTDVICFCFSFS